MTTFSVTVQMRTMTTMTLIQLGPKPLYFFDSWSFFRSPFLRLFSSPRRVNTFDERITYRPKRVAKWKTVAFPYGAPGVPFVTWHDTRRITMSKELGAAQTRGSPRMPLCMLEQAIVW